MGVGASVISSFLMLENDLKQHLPINQKEVPIKADKRKCGFVGGDTACGDSINFTLFSSEG